MPGTIETPISVADTTMSPLAPSAMEAGLTDRFRLGESVVDEAVGDALLKTPLGTAPLEAPATVIPPLLSGDAPADGSGSAGGRTSRVMRRQEVRPPLSVAPTSRE